MRQRGAVRGLMGMSLILFLAACGGGTPPSSPAEVKTGTQPATGSAPADAPAPSPAALAEAMAPPDMVALAATEQGHAGNGPADDASGSAQQGGNTPGNSGGAHDEDGAPGGEGRDDIPLPGDPPLGDEALPPDDTSENPGVGGDFPVVTAGDRQHRVRMVFQPMTHQIFAVWNDRQPDGGWRVTGRRVNAHAGAHGPVKVIAASPVEYRNTPGIAHDPATGRSLVVWSTADGDVRGRMIDQQDEGGPVQSIGASIAPEVEPVVGFDPHSGRYLVVWIEATPDFTIRAQALDGEGHPIGTSVLIAETPSGKLDLHMTGDPDTGSFLVVWRDYRGEDLYSIRGRIVAASGQPMTDELVIGDGLGAQINPQSAYDAGSRSFLVTWSDTQRTGYYELFGQVVASPDGLLLGENVFIVPFGGYEHQIEPDASGERYLMLYAKGGRRIAAQYVAFDGVAQGESFAVSTVEGRQGAPQAVFDRDQREFVAVWDDDREGGPHLFGRRIDMDGAGTDPVPPPPAECPGFVNVDEGGACVDCDEGAGVLVDEACPVTASYLNHGEYVQCVTATVNDLRQAGLIGGVCKLHLIAPRARSQVGR